MGFDEAKWLQPMGIDAVTLTFPLLIKNYLPTFDEIPRDFKMSMAIDPNVSKWVKFQRDWYERGFKHINVVPKEGIKGSVAMKHLAVLQTSFMIDSAHKTAAVAYLASLWLEKVDYTCEKGGRFGSPTR